jgi:hypothetical protein
VIVVEVQGLVRVDLGLVDALARLQVAASRAGGIVVVRNASDELRELISFAGLDDVLPTYDCDCTDDGRSSNRSGKPNSGNNAGSTK